MVDSRVTSSLLTPADGAEDECVAIKEVHVDIITICYIKNYIDEL